VDWFDVSSVKKAISDADFVVDCLSADLVVPAGGVSADFVRRESEFACGHLLTLGKTLSSSSKLVVVFRGAADVTDKEVVNFLQSPASAFARSLSLERPEVWHGMVDVSTSGTHAESAAHVVAELGCSDHEDQVAYHNGSRFALRVLPSTEE
jgi:hypothetical protein